MSRLGLARALIANPECLLLHRPTSGLDSEVANAVLQMLREFTDRRGVEYGVTSHPMAVKPVWGIFPNDPRERLLRSFMSERFMFYAP